MFNSYVNLPEGIPQKVSKSATQRNSPNSRQAFRKGSLPLTLPPIPVNLRGSKMRNEALRTACSASTTPSTFYVGP